MLQPEDIRAAVREGALDAAGDIGRAMASGDSAGGLLETLLDPLPALAAPMGASAVREAARRGSLDAIRDWMAAYDEASGADTMEEVGAGIAAAVARVRAAEG